MYVSVYLCMCVSVYKSTSKFLERQGGMNKQNPRPPNKQKRPGTIVPHGGHPKLEAPLCQGYTLQILKHLAAKPFVVTEC